MKRNSRFTRIVLAGGIVAASGGAALGLTSIASAALTGDSEALVLVAEAEQAATTPAALAGVQGVVNSAGIGKPRFASETLAEALGMTVDELHEALRSGKSLAAIAEAQGVDIDDVKKVLTDEFTAHLAEHVAEGKLTQEQADAKLEKFTERLDELVNKTRTERGEGGRGRGGRHGFGGRHGGGSEMPESPEAPESEGTGLSA